MDSDQLARLKGIFLAALEMTAAEREDYLTRECGTDTNLRREVETPLAQPSRNFDVVRNLGLMASLAEETSAQTTDPPPLPDHIGPYRILGLIGEGGMGSVYHALQAEPIRREVALKSIRAGLDSPSLRARFESERQILALMDHPNIARVLDAASDDHGHPYFVMELVRGEPITRYAADHNLSITGRLSLFRKVCRAVQDAHAKGIIHRDLKPSNILVTMHGGIPDVKIIDFGIAKATEEVMAELLTQTPTTEEGRLVGTLDYMSPEQISGVPGRVDVRADVYTLGVILYELLANALPYRVQSLPLPEALRIIETESPPTIRLSPTGHGRLPDDLNVIVGKAMEKDPIRRYDTAAQLANDVDRFLRSEPIFARSPSAVYQMRKMVGRHKATSLLAVILVTLTVGYAVSASVLLATQRRERRHAELEAVERDEISRFLVDMFGAEGSSILPPDQITARDLLERAATHIETGGDMPQSQARLLGAVGEAMSKLGLRDRAVEVLQESLDRSREVFGPRSLEAAQASLDLGDALADARRFEDAAPYLEDGSQLLDEFQGQGSEATLRARLDLANTHRGLGNLDRAEQETIDLIATLRQHPPVGDLEAVGRLRTGQLTGRGPLLQAIRFSAAGEPLRGHARRGFRQGRQGGIPLDPIVAGTAVPEGPKAPPRQESRLTAGLPSCPQAPMIVRPRVCRRRTNCPFPAARSTKRATTTSSGAGQVDSRRGLYGMTLSAHRIPSR